MIAAGATSTLSITVVPHSAGALPLTFTAAGADVDPTPDDNHADVSVMVLPAPAVITIVEAISVTDTPALRPSALLNVTEIVAVQDTPRLLPSALLGITETVTVQDTARPLPSALLGVTESIAVNDAAGARPSAMVSVTENVTVVDGGSVERPADTTPPALTLPGTVTATATSAAGAVVSYLATATDAVDGRVAPVCTPPSGTTFPIGRTTVTCVATDAHGNGSTGSFSVRVVVGLPWIAGTVAGSGRDAQGRFFVDVTFTNGGTGHARNVRLTNLNFFTLTGSGAVTYDARASGALPLTIASLDIGASSTVRLYLNVARSVRRFLAVETGTLDTVTGVRLPALAAQIIDAR